MPVALTAALTRALLCRIPWTSCSSCTTSRGKAPLSSTPPALCTRMESEIYLLATPEQGRARPPVSGPNARTSKSLATIALLFGGMTSRLGLPRLGSGFRRAAQTPRKRLNFDCVTTRLRRSVPPLRMTEPRSRFLAPLGMTKERCACTALPGTARLCTRPPTARRWLASSCLNMGMATSSLD